MACPELITILNNISTLGVSGSGAERSPVASSDFQIRELLAEPHRCALLVTGRLSMAKLWSAVVAN